MIKLFFRILTNWHGVPSYWYIQENMAIIGEALKELITYYFWIVLYGKAKE
jgi:hypothetical protein